MLLNHYKINLAIRLCKLLRYQLSISDCDAVLLKIKNTIDILINILNKCLKTENGEPRKTNVKIAIAKRVCLILKEIYRDSIIYCEWKVYTDLCNNHPDIYKSLMNKDIDAKTAYKWCNESYNKCYHVFENKLTNLLTATEFIDIKKSACITDQDLFVKTLVSILVQYKSYNILITSLNERLDSQQRIIQNLKSEMTDNRHMLEGLALRGQITELRALTTLPNGLIPAKKGNALKLISTDGDGSGASLTLFNAAITIVSSGNNYKMNDIIYAKHNKKSYYFRVIDIAQRHIFASKIDLDDLNLCVPVWIRIYKMLYPCNFDICIIQKIKQEIEEHGIQYVILKHQCIAEAYDKAMTVAF